MPALKQGTTTCSCFAPQPRRPVGHPCFWPTQALHPQPAPRTVEVDVDVGGLELGKHPLGNEDLLVDVLQPVADASVVGAPAGERESGESESSTEGRTVSARGALAKVVEGRAKDLCRLV